MFWNLFSVNASLRLSSKRGLRNYLKLSRKPPLQNRTSLLALAFVEAARTLGGQLLAQSRAKLIHHQFFYWNFNHGPEDFGPISPAFAQPAIHRL
jgi:hypothetical protein